MHSLWQNKGHKKNHKGIYHERRSTICPCGWVSVHIYTGFIFWFTNFPIGVRLFFHPHGLLCLPFSSSEGVCWTSFSALLTHFTQHVCLLLCYHFLWMDCTGASCLYLLATFFTLLATSFSHWHHLSLLTSKQFFIQTLTGKTNVWNMKGRLMLTLNTAIICSVFAESAESAHLYITHSGSEGSNGIYKFGTNRLAPANHDKGI